MVIEWKITKKRGNWRPVLQVTMTKDQWEKDLNVNGGVVKTTIPCVPGSFGMPREGSFELKPGWEPQSYYEATLPSAWELSHSFKLDIPLREDNQYPEVEESMALIMNEYEKRLRQAFESSHFERIGQLEMSTDTKIMVAPWVATVKMQ